MPEAPNRRFRHGLVLGKFYPLHAGHSALIRTAVQACDEVTVELLVASVESIPLEVRLAWLREEHPTARVVAAVDDAPVDFGDAALWEVHMTLVRDLLHRPVDAVFTSDAYGAELAGRLGATWVRVDPGRQALPVSGRAVRADPAGHWWALPPTARAWFTRRVVVVGAESTGTTTLARDLAAHHGTEWVPEYGRAYTEEREGGLTAPWRSDEFDLVTDRQMAWEAAAARRVRRPLLVCDTDVLATAVWHERYVGEAAPRLLERARHHLPALYVLTGDEIPFVQDGMRDGEHVRHAMQRRFRGLLAEWSDVHGVPWLEVTGTPAERLATAAAAVDEVVAAGVPLADPLELRPDTPGAEAARA